jgi:two-component system phosphate regulon response regulator PhoB
MVAVNTQPAHILVLEDEPTQLDVLVYNLASSGFRVAAATHVEKALKLAEHQHFDLIVADYYLPDQSGTDFVKQLRATEQYKTTPIIMLTARAEELNLAYLRDDLRVLVVAKPCPMKRFVETVSKLLEIAQCAS